MTKITVDRDPYYASCCYLICKVDENGNWNTRDERSTILVQTDWDWPSIAANFGWTGDLDDPEQIPAAREYLDEHLCEIIEDPGYFN